MLEKTLEGYLYEEFIYCFCGCGLTRSKYDKDGKERQFITGHATRGKGKGWYIANGYRRVKCPPEFQHLANSRGYVYEHRLIYQMNHPEIKLMSNVLIHHENKEQLDNDIKNLDKKTRPEHARLHATKDMSGWFCVVCGSKEAYIEKNGRPHWRNVNGKDDRDGHICQKCYFIERVE